MAYVTGYSAERAKRLLKNINAITTFNDTNITDAVKHLLASSTKNKDVAYDVYQVDVYSIDAPTDALITVEEEVTS